MRLIKKNIIAFVDLDDTLITSRRKSFNQKNSEKSSLICENSTFMRDTIQLPHQNKLETIIRHSDCFVPVTGRTAESCLKVLNNRIFDIAFVHFGGWAILPNNLYDNDYIDLAKEWNEYTTLIRLDLQSELNKIFHHIELAIGIFNEPLRVKINTTPDGLNNELVIKYESIDSLNRLGWERFIKSIEKYCCDLYGSIEESPFSLHINGNNFTVLISKLIKNQSVKHFLNRHATDETLILGAGDSLTDLGFMYLTDVMIIPTNSQITESLKNEYNI
ncbi:MAG: hypothetical protein CMH98_20955 [Oceanospirillaceae bacterium]|nr:hypothetical protein [Oceanospirillaceae bacterium]